MKEDRVNYCHCNGCKTRRYAAAAMFFNMLIAAGVWVTVFF